MHKRYTPQAGKVLELAEKLAKKLQHNYIGTEHILAGLLQEGTGVAAKVLAENHLEEKKLLELIEELISPGDRAILLRTDIRQGPKRYWTRQKKRPSILTARRLARSIFC